MATVVDIANLALSRLGDRATVTSISPPEGSAQADHVARFWPMARDTALEAAPWRFATAREALTATDYETGNWSYAYFLPTDCLLVRRVLPPTSATNSGAIFDADAIADDWDIRFDIETDDTGAKVLLTNQEDAVAIFTKRVVDPSKYTTAFTDAVARLLESYLAGSVIKGQAGAKAAQLAYNAYAAMIARAAATEVNQSNTRRDYVPGAMAARGVAFGNNRRVGR